jgi:predicted 3-demethylubiquinone-9 3-methyltransferase (glyoxalase superfamily)
MVTCEDQAEVDRYWETLTRDGGKEIQCGWLVDKYGLSWQIVPKVFFELVSGGDAARTQRVMKAMLQMKKFDIAKLKEAAAG